MTGGGKPIRSSFGDSGNSPFAPLRPLIGIDQQDIPAGIASVSSALDQFPAPATVHLQILDGSRALNWDVRSGPTQAREYAPPDADIRLVMRRDTWMRIAQGSLAPFDALFEGKVAVGGDTELAKRLVEHLSDPAVPYVPPCQG